MQASSVNSFYLQFKLRVPYALFYKRAEIYTSYFSILILSNIIFIFLFVLFWFLQKSTLTSENLLFDAQYNFFFISWKSHVLFLGYSCILNNPISFKSCDFKMKIITQCKEHFFWVLLHYVMKLDQPIKAVMDSALLGL